MIREPKFIKAVAKETQQETLLNIDYIERIVVNEYFCVGEKIFNYTAFTKTGLYKITKEQYQTLIDYCVIC